METIEDGVKLLFFYNPKLAFLLTRNISDGYNRSKRDIGRLIERKGKRMNTKVKSQMVKATKSKNTQKFKSRIERAREITSKVDQPLSDLLLELRYGKNG